MKTAGQQFEELVSIMARLRNPQGGCPWDLEQNHETLKPYVIEEAYEVVDAIEHKPEKLPEELGDLLLQVVFHAQLGTEAKTFTIEEVLSRICEKLIRRHPHVFGETKVAGAEQVLQNWEQIKKGEQTPESSILDGVPRSMPALLRSQRVGEKAARVGFDWQSQTGVRAKILEEIKEFLAAQENMLAATEDSTKQQAAEELGDLLFALVQWARKAGFNAEEVLSRACDKFSARFRAMEKTAPRPLKEMNAGELDELWNQIKRNNPHQ